MADFQKIAIFGVGGYATEILDVCDALAINDVVFIDDSDSLTEYRGVPVVSEKTAMQPLQDQGYAFAIGIATPRIRQKIVHKYPHLNFPNLIHPSATFGRGQLEAFSLCKGTVIGAGARFMSGIQIGDFCVVSLNVTVGHDSVLGDYTTMMPGANISGFVQLVQRNYIGTNAVVLQGIEKQPLVIGADIVVGAGAVVTQGFDKQGTLIGVPAKYMSEI